MSTASLAASSQEDAGNASANGVAPPIYGGPRKMPIGGTARYASANTLSITSAAGDAKESSTSSVFSGLKPPTALGLGGKPTTFAPAVFKPAAVPVQPTEDSVGEVIGSSMASFTQRDDQSGERRSTDDLNRRRSGQMSARSHTSGGDTARSRSGTAAPPFFRSTAAEVHMEEKSEISKMVAEANNYNGGGGMDGDYPTVYDTAGNDSTMDGTGFGTAVTGHEMYNGTGGGYDVHQQQDSRNVAMNDGDVPDAVVNPVTLEILTFWSYYRKCGYEVDAMAEWVQQVR